MGLSMDPRKSCVWISVRCWCHAWGREQPEVPHQTGRNMIRNEIALHSVFSFCEPADPRSSVANLIPIETRIGFTSDFNGLTHIMI